MKSYLMFLFLFFLYSDYILAQCDICKEAMIPAYNNFMVKNDKEYIETLHSIYELDQIQYENRRKKDGLSAILPTYGSADYKSNKEKVKQINTRVRNSVDFNLKENEHLEIFSQTVSDEVRISQLSAFSKCIAQCNGKPYLTIAEYSLNDAVVILHLPINAHNARKKAKVKGIVLSDGLTIKDDSFFGKSIPYGESRALVLDRTLDQVQSVYVNLRKENFVFTAIPKFKKGPDFKLMWMDTNSDGKLLEMESKEFILSPIKKTKLSAKKHPITRARKKITYYDPGILKGEIDLKLAADRYRISKVNLNILNGKGASQNHKVIVKNNKLYLDYDIRAAVSENVKVKYYMQYQELRSVCVENCEQ